MKREQGIWLGGGLAVGFLAGWLVAYLPTVETTIGGVAPVAAPAPAAAAGASQAGDPHTDVRDMLDELNQRLEANPQDIRVLAQLAEIYMQAGMADQSLGYLDRIDAVEPDRFQTGLMRAMALESLGREDEFATLVTGMTARFADRWESHYLLAAHLLTHHHDEGDLARARQALDRVDDLQPGIPEAAELRSQLERAEAEHGDGGDRSG